VSSVRRAAACGLILLLVACGAEATKKKDVSESRANAHYQFALRLYEQGQVRNALAQMLSAVELEPNNAVYRNSLGFVYFSLGEYDLARENYDKAIRLDPAFTEVRVNLALVESEQGRYAQAEADYRRALADPAYPTPEKVYVNWALTLRKRGDLAGAETMIRKSLEASPRYPRAHFELGRLLEEQGKGDAALEAYLKAWEGMPELAELNLRLGEIYCKRGESDRARPYLEKVIAAAPTSVEAEKARMLLRGCPSR
jgi:type IV pilus biogenesis/stability protein PilW